MNVSIIGAGRLGSALAHRSTQRGHTTAVSCRSFSSPSNRQLPEAANFAEIRSSTASDADIVFIAAPANHNEGKERLITDFLNTLSPGVPIFSTVSYPGAPLMDWGKGRNLTELMCSAAIANTKQRPIIIAKTKNKKKLNTLREWAGPCKFFTGVDEEYERYSSLFLATAIHCDVICRATSLLVKNANSAENQFVTETLLEAHSLLKYSEYDPALALDLCLTPGGKTAQVLHELFDAPKLYANPKQNG